MSPQNSPLEISQKIFFVRGYRVMLDADLALPLWGGNGRTE